MTPTNSHPGTTARGPRRAFLLQAALGLLAALIAAPAPALAQNVIQFSVGGGSAFDFTRYQVGDDGTNREVLDFPQAPSSRIQATTRNDYWDGPQYVGRLYLYSQDDGSNTGYGAARVWSEETRQSKAITNFQYPYATGASNPPLWSNDGRDSLISFVLRNKATGESWNCRSQVSAADIASASFQPITLADLGTPRLERLTGSGGVGFHWWKHDGSGFYYQDSRSGNHNLIRAKTVGFGATVDEDPVVFVAPVELSELRVIPPVDPANPVSDRYLVASVPSTGSRGPGNGILAIDLGTSVEPSRWWWLATQPTWTVSGIRGPCFSPDGTHIAFGNSRSVTATIGKKKTTTTYYGVYTVPFFGGPISPPVTEVTGTGYVTVNNWDLP